MISFRGAVYDALLVIEGCTGSSAADGETVSISCTVTGDAAFGGGPLSATALPSDIIWLVQLFGLGGSVESVRNLPSSPS